MKKNYLGMLMLTEDTKNMASLTDCRPIGAIPIGARYRIIDFMLSNMVNTGIQNVSVFTKDNYSSLYDYLGTGKAWDLDRNNERLFLFNHNYSGSSQIDATIIKNNMEYFYRSKQENVIMASSYMLCNIDLDKVIENHEKSGKDITIVYKKVNGGDKNFIDCDILNMDKNNKVLSIGKSMGLDGESNISMEIFLMKKEFLINIIYKYIEQGAFSCIKNYIYKNIKKYNVNTYEFTGYLRCINSVKQYYEANKDLLNYEVLNELFFNKGYIYTKIRHEPPSRYSSLSKVSNSLIGNGCLIEGTVENSIISRRVKIHKNAVIKNSVILQKCEIGESVNLNCCILDKNIKVFEDTILSGTEDFPLVISKNSKVNSLDDNN